MVVKNLCDYTNQLKLDQIKTSGPQPHWPQRMADRELPIIAGKCGKLGPRRSAWGAAEGQGRPRHRGPGRCSGGASLDGAQTRPAGRSPESREGRRSWGQGCLTAEVTERHDALVPTSTESPPLARNLRRSALGAHGSLWQRTAPTTARSRGQTRREVNGLGSARTRRRKGGQQGKSRARGEAGVGLCPWGASDRGASGSPPHTLQTDYWLTRSEHLLCALHNTSHFLNSSRKNVRRHEVGSPFWALCPARSSLQTG